MTKPKVTRMHYAYAIPCPTCGAIVGERCRNLNHLDLPSCVVHAARVYAANDFHARFHYGHACHPVESHA